MPSYTFAPEVLRMLGACDTLTSTAVSRPAHRRNLHLTRNAHILESGPFMFWDA
jgi:hypothetical protein